VSFIETRVKSPPSAGDFVGDTVDWDTLAPRITEFGCRSVVRDGPVSPDKAGMPHLRQVGEDECLETVSIQASG
jgi:hypothetical protein